MKVIVRDQQGHDLSLEGMAYSYKDRALLPADWWPDQKERAYKRAPLLAPKGAGHNKFLRQIFLWIEVEAPRAFWSEFDTYKVGTVAQSESTMHTLAKRPPTAEDFEEGTAAATIQCFIDQWPELKADITRLKENLPEGYLQRRMVTMSYDNVRSILVQRLGHRYKRWATFVDQLVPQLYYPEYIQDLLP